MLNQLLRTVIAAVPEINIVKTMTTKVVATQKFSCYNC
jgi:hypothetical protein